MDSKILSKICDVIIWGGRGLWHKFTNAEIITFFVEAWLSREVIMSFVWENKVPRLWLWSLLKDLHDNWSLKKILRDISSQIRFYNPDFISKLRENINIGEENKIWFLTPWNWKEKKMAIFDEILKDYDWKVEVFNIYEYWNEKFLWPKIKNFLESCSMFIVDLRGLKPNVLLELGYILALNKPTIITMLEWEPKPSDINWIIYVQEKIFSASDGDEWPKIKEDFEAELKIAIKEKIDIFSEEE
jgi:nucleoside 2-deoxyribosyltransferase